MDSKRQRKTPKKVRARQNRVNHQELVNRKFQDRINRLQADTRGRGRGRQRGQHPQMSNPVKTTLSRSVVPAAVSLETDNYGLRELGNPSHKEFGKGVRVGFSSLFGTVQANTSAADSFIPLIVGAYTYLTGVTASNYSFLPFHPALIPVLNVYTNVWGQYAIRRLVVRYKPMTTSNIPGGIIFALSRDWALYASARTGVYGSLPSGYTMPPTTVSNIAAQSLHASPSFWEPASVRMDYKGDRTYFTSVPGEDSGLTRTQMSELLDKFYQSFMMIRYGMVGSYSGTATTGGVGNIEVSGIIDFYEGRAVYALLPGGFIGGNTTITLSTGTTSSTTSDSDATISIGSLSLGDKDVKTSKEASSSRTRSRSPSRVSAPTGAEDIDSYLKWRENVKASLHDVKERSEREFS